MYVFVYEFDDTGAKLEEWNKGEEGVRKGRSMEKDCYMIHVCVYEYMYGYENMYGYVYVYVCYGVCVWCMVMYVHV